MHLGVWDILMANFQGRPHYQLAMGIGNTLIGDVER